MAFRDETEALRQRARTLQASLDDLRKERLVLEEETRTIATSAEERARKLAPRTSLFTLMIGVALAGLAVAGFVAGASGSNSRTYYGNVAGASGAAPVPEGARCTVFVSEPDSEDHRSQVGVLCDGRVLYGGGSLGYVGCDDDDGVATHCEDESFTSEGGDPKLIFDRARGRVRVEDSGPAWVVDIAFGGAQP